MKTKILALLLVIPAVILAVYYTVGAQLFEDDKIAYIYSHSQESSVAVKKEMRSYYGDMNNFFVALINAGEYPLEYFDFFANKYNLNGIKLYDITDKPEVIISYGDPFKAINPKSIKTNEIVFRKAKKGDFFKFGQIKAHQGKRYYLSMEVKTPSFISIMSESSFNTTLFDKNGRSIAQYHKEKENSKFKPENLKKVFALSKDKAKLGVQTTSVFLEGKEYLSTFVPISLFDRTYYYVSLYPKEKALMAMRYFKAKTLLLALLVLSLSGIIGVFVSNFLTYSLNQLKLAAQELSNENFDQEIKITSTDEIGVLASAFDTMRINVRDLLEKIREYNLTLEDKVEERTAALNEALALQKTMVDNLEEGFFMFKKGAELLPVYTEASKSMLPGIGEKELFVDICGVDDQERDSLIEFCDLMLSGDLPFDDVVGLAPQEYINDKERHIHFNYAPVVDENGKNKYIVVSAKDKTDQIIAMEEARKEKMFVDGMITFLQKKSKFFSFINEYKKQREYYIGLEKTDMEQMRVFVHTLKGNAGIYHLTELVDYLHQWEEDFKYNESDEVFEPARIKDVFDNVTQKFNNEIKQYEMILDLSDIDEIKQSVELEISRLEEFRDQHVLTLDNIGFAKEYEKEFMFESVSELLPDFGSEASRIALTLGKEINPLNLVGTEERVPRYFKRTIDNLVHMLRNAMDHAIEMPSVREEAGKDRKGTLGMYFMKVGEDLEIRVVDDGAGINFAKIIEIYTENNGPMPEGMVKEDLLFLDGLSSRQEASEISGRGVGMGALKEAVESMGGSIEVFTKLKQGTTFILKIPLFNEKMEQKRQQQAA